MTPKIELRFRRCLYLTLAAACVGLGYAEFPFLNGMAVFTAIVLALMAIAYRLEGRWSMSLGLANVLGGVIAAGAVGWVYWQYSQPSETVINQLPWPTMLLPFLGPLLMILIPAKLFRPKNFADFWGMQLIGLMAIALGSSMTDDPFFVVIMFVYLVFAFASLTLFYSLRVSDPSAMPRLGWRSLIGSASLTAFAMAMFLATPRFVEARWELGTASGRLHTGVNEERPGIDLNMAGTLKISGDLAFEVTSVFADGRPKYDLPPNQRWRSTTFNYYWNGRWDARPWRRRDEHLGFPNNRGLRPSRVAPRAVDADEVFPPLGPDRYYLTFRLPPKTLATPILADPVWLGGPAGRVFRYAPAVTISESSLTFPWYQVPEGDPIPPEVAGPQGRYTYRQILAPLPDPRVSPPAEIDGQLTEHLAFIQGLPHLRRWTHNVVGLLVSHGQLPAEVYREDDPEFRPDPRHHEAMARAFENYLSVSGDFRYSLALTRKDLRMDPVEDFVLHTRRGHCNRFSTALALMCRTQGIPTRIVLGYLGFESPGDGHYTVRQSHAHSWVEALIRRTDAEGVPRWHWLTLDASPLSEAVEDTDSRLGRWLDDMQRGTTRLFKSFIIDYDADTQEATRLALGALSWNNVGTKALDLAQLLLTDAAAIGLVVVALTLVLFEFRRRGGSNGARSPLERKLTALAQRLGVAVKPSQTWQELATGIAAGVADADGELGRTPQVVANRLYGARFGGQPISAADEAALTERLARLENTLLT